MTKVYVANTSPNEIQEYKPGIGLFTIPANDRIEIKDFIQKTKLPNGQEVEYVYSTAEQVANSIVKDRGRNDLEVQVEGDLAAKAEEPKKEDPKKPEEPKKEDPPKEVK